MERKSSDETHSCGNLLKNINSGLEESANVSGNLEHSNIMEGKSSDETHSCGNLLKNINSGLEESANVSRNLEHPNIMERKSSDETCAALLKNNKHEQIKFSNHARVRQEQRNITDNSVSAVIQSGEQMDCKDTNVYTNENIKVVFAKDSNTVVTVCKNARNTRFQISERTKEKERSLLYKANVQYNDHAMCELAELYLTGELGEKDVGKAYSLFEKAAKKGNSHAMCKISQLYENGDLGEPNQESADTWLKKAADRNNIYALGLLGQRLLCKYQENYPIAGNMFRPSAPKKEILHYLNKAADKGSTRAMWTLGYIHEKGLFGTQNLSEAQEMYVKAAKTGSPASLDSLYEMSLEGCFSATELEDILDNLSTFLGTTSVGMCLDIGEKQLCGNLGYNPVRGLNMIEQAALKKHVQAIKTLAKCYRDGEGCDANLKLAQYWFMKLYELYDISAKAGNVTSLWKLGKLYLNGNVGNIDLTKAESCFKEAIEKSSNPDWMYQLGKLYLNGRLGDKPINTGLQFITRVINIWELKAAQGDKTVYSHLGVAYYSMNAFKNSVYWLSQSSSSDINSQLFLAKIYLNDLLPEKNIPLGLKILESIILEHGVAASEAFKIVNFRINDQTLCWLHNIADDITKPISEKGSNQYKLQQFTITTLANVYEEGKLGEVDYKLASKYYYQLFTNFESISAGNKLLVLYHDQHLPTEYYDTAKNFALQIPALIETDKINQSNFINCVMSLGKTYQKGNLLSYDIEESTKWLYLALYFIGTSNINTIQEIEDDLSKLPQLDYTSKEQMVHELSQITLNMKVTSSLPYKKIIRIVGDIFYDSRIINQNLDKAIYWYTESAMKNNSKASLSLAKIYQNDKQDIDASIKWYMSSIQQGNKDALKTLTSMAVELKLDHLSSFLSRYEHKSSVEQSELIDIKPLKNLESYPKTTKKMFKQGKYHLNLKDNQDMNSIINAAFWFRKALKRGFIDAAVELYLMYKSGILGINLIPVADNLYPDILSACFRLENTLLLRAATVSNQNTPLTLSVLDKISVLLKTRTSSNELNEKIEKITNQTDNICTKMVKDVIADLALLIQLEYDTIGCTLSESLDRISLLGEEAHSTS